MAASDPPPHARHPAAPGPAGPRPETPPGDRPAAPAGRRPAPPPHTTPAPPPGANGAGPAAPLPPSGTFGRAPALLDALGVAAVVLEDGGRIALWSPQAEDLLGYRADQVLGLDARRLLTSGDAARDAGRAFDDAMRRTGGWSGVLPLRHRDGRTRRIRLRGTRLHDEHGHAHVLALAAGENTVRRTETGLALALRLVSQSPIGLAVFGTDLRYLSVNPALEAINGLPERDHLGRTCAELLPGLDTDTITSALREVLATGEPLVDQHVLGRTPADPGSDHAWSVSFYRLDGPGGRVLGLASQVIDITERIQAHAEAVAVRRRLALIADASERIGTTLDLERTARELAELCVPALADVAAVDVLDSVLHGTRAAGHGRGPATFRALAVVADRPGPAVRAADPPGQVARYGPDRLITRCATTGDAVLVPHVMPRDLQFIARDPGSAAVLAEAGVHSYLAVPLIARGEVIGVLDLKRAANPLPFTHDDESLAAELASRAAVCVDNARWYQAQRHAALALQRHLLPDRPPRRPGLEIAYRYAPAEGPSRVGGDWFDVIGLDGGRTALVVGDVMGSGINAAATMGQVRTATRTLAELDLPPDALLRHLDRITDGLESGIATCLYAVYDPTSQRCRIATAGHLPPVLTRPGEPPRLLDLPTGAPLGVGGVPFEITDVELGTGDQLVLYTDGLVEARDQSIEAGLAALLALLGDPSRPLEQTCDLLLETLRRGGEPDDVALLVSRIGPPRDGPAGLSA